MIYETIAAVDLGSNSFRLQVGRVVGNQIYPLDSLKEPVRLASGLDERKMLDAASQERALEALRRLGERLRGLDAGAVRAVATNTLRVAKNAADFLPQAEAALGFPIEVIAGREEARLVYLGASHSLPTAAYKRLVVDIGGGSTECIIGKRHVPQLTESLYMGCVSYTQRFFPGGKVDKRRWREAQVAAARQIQHIVQEYRQRGWKEAVGTSGTAKAIADALEQNALNPGGEEGITQEGLARLSALLIKAGSAERLELRGLKADRLPVLAGGVVIMQAIFEAFALEHMVYADGALRLGVLYDQLGRFHQHDMRDATVEQFRKRYHVERQQVERVERMALDFFAQLYPGEEREAELQLLSWGCRLHEIGISVAHNAYHRHGAYILTHADMPGFSRKDQAQLATLVLGHRGKLDKLPPLSVTDPLWPLIFCLRLAALFCRAREDREQAFVQVAECGKGFSVRLPAAWLAENPWTATALLDETHLWRQVGKEFQVVSRD